MPYFCVYALTAILQVRQVASFHSQHGICVVLFMLIANNRVWFGKKTYKHFCDFCSQKTFFKIYLLFSTERCFWVHCTPNHVTKTAKKEVQQTANLIWTAICFFWQIWHWMMDFEKSRPTPWLDMKKKRISNAYDVFYGRTKITP